ncbi:hypothetical protein NA56DRAFT_640267 [Hyaloscypha hepaticicola]|uniref:Uncharacterized protein n=1 Tax=Hyaloscypha hepaticicola TaxID=2082293 RepID=A0A2J6QQY4_9HELO|nr:hypothetical protein NA56DRAFT_640267 [Hyaloscypha hepaticicola]
MASLNTVPVDDHRSPLPSAGRDATQKGIEKKLTTSDLLDSINSKIPPPDTVLEELKILRAIHKQLRSESTKIQFLWNAFLQIMGIVFVIIFGVFSVMAYKIGQRANTQASEANQLALLSLCFGSNSSIAEALCGDVFQRAAQTVPVLVTQVMGPVPVVPENSSSTPSPGSGLGESDKIAVGVGVCAVLSIVLGVLVGIWKQKFENETPTSTSRA